jgi:hypothetical protein
MAVARSGARAIFEPRALAWDVLSSSSKQEFQRKVRTLFGNYQLLRFAPWLLTAANPLRFEFISHKLSRLAVPFALISVNVASAFLSGFVYPIAVGIGLAALGAMPLVRAPLGCGSRVAELALAFILLNTAALVAFFYFAIGKKQVCVH